MIRIDRHGALLSRLAIPLSALCVMIALTTLSELKPDLYNHVMRSLIEWPGTQPFEDWAVTPTSLGCWAKGVIVYLPNSCSPIFNYMPFMLLLPAPPAGPTWNIIFGFSIALSFFAILALLSPAQSRLELAVRWVATLSPAVALAIERGNLDVILFTLLLIGALAVARRGTLAVAGYGIFIFAALCKLYPIAALFLLVREKLARFIAVLLVAAGAAIWCLFRFKKELEIILRNFPSSSEWTMEFKGKALAEGASAGLVHLTAIHPYAKLAEIGLFVLSITSMIVGGIAVWRACATRGVRLPEQQTVLLPMLMGAAVTLFCFVFGQNYIYREVYILPVLPGLFMMARSSSPSVGRAINTTSLIIAGTFWAPLIRDAAFYLGIFGHGPSPKGVLWLAYQLSWWYIAIILFAVLFASFYSSTIGCMILRDIGKRQFKVSTVT